MRLAARLVDMPPAELTTDAYAEECRLLASQRTRGYRHLLGNCGGGTEREGIRWFVWDWEGGGVPPTARFVVMDYQPAGGDTTKTVALVGKGIVYNTGTVDSNETRHGRIGRYARSLLHRSETPNTPHSNRTPALPRRECHRTQRGAER